MFSILKQLKSSKNKDIRKRIYFTLFALFIFFIGTTIKVPGTKDYTSSLGFVELLNVMGGGALKRFSLLALGVMPYITSEIIMELLQMDIIPYFSELKKQGPVGRQKITKIGRYLGIFVAFIQGIVFSFLINGSNLAPTKVIYIATVLTAGTAFLMWLGDQITRKGLGNGLSLIIMAGIVFSLPEMFKQAFSILITSGKYQFWIGLLLFIAFVIVYALIIVGVVFVQEAERRVPIKYVNKTTTFESNDKSFMPFKINSAGVIPVIFASSLMAIISTVAQFTKNQAFIKFTQNYLDYTKITGIIIFAVLIYIFSYFYTYIQIKPEELAKNLNENGGFIPGIRPGKETENYVTKLLMSVTFLGGAFIVIIAILPILFNKITNLPQVITLGGTGLLIVVGVALETYKQLEGSLVARNYKREYRKK